MERKFAKLHEYRGKKFLIHTHSDERGANVKHSYELLSPFSGTYYQEKMCGSKRDALEKAHDDIDKSYTLSGYTLDCDLVIG